MRRADVIDLKVNLQAAGFGDFSNTNYYGPQTRSVVEDFQNYYGLDVTGQAGQDTINKLSEVLGNPLQDGNYHDNAVTIKDYLMTLDYGDFSKTRYYGPQTESAVKNFQRDHNLIENGIVDGPTLSQLEYEITRPLENGMRRADVIDLKVNLQAAGFGDFSETNYYGPQTKGVVEDFQDYYGLEVDGVAGETTLNQLEEVL
ncbi:peptidoglycan-binding domain-containing protein, partial [Alkalibacillus haloalkaliphilus]|uniref:peptidoglycan-binding domain-containing protein n=1 Tax=Alkalibacillus haloalkaliphilus TaxID=94136 RepID=UPI0011BE5E63